MTPPEDSYPRQKARTRGFQCGRPRAFTVVGSRAFFIRSTSGSDPAGSLWQIDLAAADPVETCLVDAATLPAAIEGQVQRTDLPPAERARRERMREVTSGLTSFSLDTEGTRAAFAVDGIAFVADLASGSVRALSAPGAVVDPRIDPSGSMVAFVIDRALHVWDIDADRGRVMCEPDADSVSWGLADFIAAEELGRYRGHWWIDGGTALLVARVDESGVAIRWIGDPAQPELEPTPHRYPAAGTDNARVSLWRVELDGQLTQLSWDAAAFEYLASVHADEVAVTLSVLSRDQRRMQILGLDRGQSALRVLAERTDPDWLDVIPGSPVRDGADALVEVLPDRSSDTMRVMRNGAFISPEGLQVSAILDATEDAVVVTASADPMRQDIVRIDIGTAEVTPLTRGAGWASGMAKGGVLVTVEALPDEPTARFTARNGQRECQVVNRAEVPMVSIAPHLARVGERSIATCLLWPADHRPGTRLPVILSPYAGPHAQRVVAANGAYATEQWLADQGYAVIVADGRGTPGRGPAWERAITADWAAAVVDDQVQALRGLAADYPDLDTSRVGIRGWSFGGYLAALAVMDRPDVFHAAVAGAPVTEWRLYDTAYTERYLGDPTVEVARYDRASLLPRAARLHRPLLLIHGLADDNVLIAHTLRLSSALLAAGRAHAVLPLSGVTHMTPQEVVAENLLRREVDFFAEHLAAGITAPSPG